MATPTSSHTDGVASEVGTLRSVIVHRPELALERLSPSNCHELLLDDVIWTHRARQEHDAFVDVIDIDVDAVYADWGTPQQRAIRAATPEELAAADFAAGSMGPKVRAACWFAERTDGFAVIGSIHETAALLRGDAGTRVARAAVQLQPNAAHRED
jgi:hypothetical protein